MAKSNIDKLLEIKDKFKSAYNAVSYRHDKWIKYFNYYMSSEETVYNQYKKSRILPIAFSIISSILPRILSQKPKIRYMMRQYPDYFDDALEELERQLGDKYDIERMRRDAINALDFTIKWQWSQMDGDLNFGKLILNSLIYGTGIMMVYWSEEKNSPMLKVLEPFYFYPEAGCSDAKDMTHCFTVNYLTEGKLREMFKNKIYRGVNVDKVISKNIGSYNDYIYMEKLSSDNNYGSLDKLIKVVEYYDKNEIITYIGEDIVRREKNKLGVIPFIVLPNYVVPGDFWGMSEIDQIEQYIKDKTDFRANRHINVELNSNCLWRADPNRQVEMTDLVSAPGQVVRAEQGALEPLRPPSLPPEVYREDQMFDRDITDTTGLSDYMRGGTPERFETATTVQNLVKSGNMRIILRSLNIVAYCIKPLGKLFIEYNRKFIKPLNIIYQENNEYKIFPLRQDFIKLFEADFDVIVTARDIEDVKKAELVQIIQAIGNSQQMAEQVNFREFLRELLDQFNINTSKIFKTDKEIQAEKEQAMAMQQQQIMMQQRAKQAQQQQGGK